MIDLGFILYDNGATITRTNTCRQHTSKAVTCAMCMHGCITECYLIFTDYLTIQGHQFLEVSSQVCHIGERIWKNKGRSEEAIDHIEGQEDLGTLDEIHLQHSKGGTLKYTTSAASWLTSFTLCCKTCNSCLLYPFLLCIREET